MKILVVEDDRAVALSLQLLLSSYHYAVDTATDGEAALQMADAFEYDLVLLDVLLPRLDGIEVCRHLRKQGFQQPILLLTGQGETQQKTVALNAGADDYVVKPFDAGELIARIQALLRRGVATGEPVLTWGHLSLDPNARRVSYSGQLLQLTPKEYAILELFLRHQETVFSARSILDRAWNSLESPAEEAVRSHIKELRQKLTTAGAPRDLITTVYRVGYRLNPLYAAPRPDQISPQSNAPQVAELQSVNGQLRAALEQLQTTQTALQHKNQELERIQQTLLQERQQLQATQDQLKQQVSECTTALANQPVEQSPWQTLFDHAVDAIAIADDHGQIVDANPAACAFFQLPRGRLSGFALADFADPAEGFALLWQQLHQQGNLSSVLGWLCQDGTRKVGQLLAIARLIPGRHLVIFREHRQYHEL